ncbi:hypothetical protein FJ938_07685 [Mesorhizobium sp. B2-4-14]|uniref:hypothetical protein n=1 Tax=Mesorhizobium sp. B2-4-14 TaxID=2589935 RepID=UPI00112B7061|nr:hypothetical protein [Mesorhizobium sp. B2-4-14]TPL08852.1 hypothetical protein FJ938_07685 [Mesorhizobium sp. B2-4-14]
MTGEAWFRPKRFGYGATPGNWKGWAFVVVFILVVVALVLGHIAAALPAWLIVLVILALTGAIIPFIKAKTDGE